MYWWLRTEHEAELKKRCTTLETALQREIARSARLKNEIEVLVAIGEEYGVTLKPGWIERLKRIVEEESQVEVIW